MFSSNEQDDPIVFKALYEQHFGKVYRFVLRNIRDSDEAEDLTHDVFLKLWQNRGRFSLTIPADAQLLVIARQLIINNYRRDMVKQRVFGIWRQESSSSTSADVTEQLVRANEMTLAIEEAVQGLPPKRREIFEKSRFEGLSYDEIAVQMAISRNTVESQMVKALQFLRQKLPLLPVFIFFF